MDSLTTFAEAVFDAVRKIPGADKFYEYHGQGKTQTFIWEDNIHNEIENFIVSIYNKVIGEENVKKDM